jgi:hypothetical protein
MNQELLAWNELDLTPEEHTFLEQNPALRETLEARLSCCARQLQRLPRSKLRRLVWGHLQDLLTPPPPPPFPIAPAERAAAPTVTDEEIDRRFGRILQGVPPELRARVREKLRRGMALSRLR